MQAILGVCEPLDQSVREPHTHHNATLSFTFSLYFGSTLLFLGGLEDHLYVVQLENRDTRSCAMPLNMALDQV